MVEPEPRVAGAAVPFDETPLTPEMVRWAIPASLALHVFLLLILTMIPHELEPPTSRPVAADILTEAEYNALFRPPAEEELPQESPQATAPVEEQPPDEFTSATSFHASDILNDPANGEVRRNLPRLAPSEQVVQLCNIEALEQLRLNGADEADALVGYAYAPIDFDGLALKAEGGAYRSEGQWFHIRYRCTVAADVASVVLFEYAIGELVPETEWEAHYLNADDDWLN